jgi:hypothetical protein
MPKSFNNIMNFIWKKHQIYHQLLHAMDKCARRDNYIFYLIRGTVGKRIIMRNVINNTVRVVEPKLFCVKDLNLRK